jgi:hypothetical protein
MIYQLYSSFIVPLTFFFLAMTAAEAAAALGNGECTSRYSTKAAGKICKCRRR